VNFLESHRLPRGNLYKLVDNFVLGLDELRYQAAFAPTNAADFFNIENTLNGFQSREWLEANANYTNWYRYHAIAEAIRHYDIWPSANKNGSWYFEPVYTAANNFLGRMMQLPYDGTDTWGPTWNTGEDVLFNGIFPSGAAGGDAGQNPDMQKEYRNVVREIRDLLFQPDQINAIIDAFAAPLLPFSPADFARWAAAPSPSGYNSIIIPGSPGAASGLAAYAQDMKNFMFVGGNNAWWIDRQTVAAGGWVTRLDQIANADTSIPTRPTITYAGLGDFPADGLVFQSSVFADPNGSGTFGAIQWRVAQVLGPGEVASNPDELRLEWDAEWDSGELASFNEFITVPAALIEPERLYRARVRHKGDSGRWSRWSAPVEFRPRAADIVGLLRANLVISEIMYNPPASGGIDGDEFEFLELRNIGTNTLDLTGLSFGGINFTFTNATKIAPGAVFLLARNPGQLAARYPGVIVNGVYTGRLDNSGETLTISHLHAGEILSVTYDDRAPWPATADGFGFSLVLANGAYAASAQSLGSPGVNVPANSTGGVVVNEVLSSSTSPLQDYIELHNTTSANIDISGWYLTDDPTFPWKYRIPDGTVLGAGAYVVFDETHFNSEPGVGSSFSLSSFGDDVYLFSSSGPGELSGYSHGFEFGGAQGGVSFGRHINSVGAEQFTLQLSRTPNTANSGPRFGPIAISEIHYHPRNPADEFLELHNPTAGSIALADESTIPANMWRIGGLNYEFPLPVTIPPFGYLLLVADDPDVFRARWNIPPDVEVLPYFGVLQDSGENLQLLAPDEPTTNGVPYYAVDTVRYNDRRPWPLAADGGGASLQRLSATEYGDDPINWVAARPTPGRPPMGGTAPSIIGQPQPSILTNAVGGIASFTAQA
ncbi:MAG TPA: lamin tail domain-containing protein, partial [Verrucomicrobiae bacterium]|nr:lamin tail domain-containing protein [Verrucomicrobiae bacterium]